MNRFSLEEIDLAVHNIWESVLGFTITNRADNFYYLGGNSIQAFEIVNKLNEHFRLTILIIDFFNALTIDKMSAMIHQAQND